MLVPKLLPSVLIHQHFRWRVLIELKNMDPKGRFERKCSLFWWNFAQRVYPPSAFMENNEFYSIDFS